ncbi:hypothetical protein ACH4S9_16685 [Streptomyces sp. NPDC021225]|uniref:hypothetical protein n=1 Tax=Streptomyces sp. NPDC021225 TaxID=3365121 RepID=UPI0037B123B1
MTVPPQPTSTAFLLAALGRHVRGDVEHTLKPTGYTLRHLATLGHLRREPGLSEGGDDSRNVLVLVGVDSEHHLVGGGQAGGFDGRCLLRRAGHDCPDSRRLRGGIADVGLGGRSEP